jgi:hypothetical protein
MWILMALTLTEGINVSIVSGNLYVLEILGGYILVRAYCRTPNDLDCFIRYLKMGMIFIVIVGAIDHTQHQHWFMNLVSGHLGDPRGVDFRNGFLRAQATFDHPILYGTFCSFAAILIFYNEKSTARALAYLALCCAGCVLAQSSAPLLSLMAALGMMTYDRVLRAYPWRWKLLVTGIAVGIVALWTVSNNPLSFLIRTFTLDPQTGYFRLLIWEYAGDEVLNSPWIGIGFREWQRPSFMGGSIDSLWLGLAVTYGIPCSIFVIMMMLLAMRGAGPRSVRPDLNSHTARMSSALSMVLSLTIFICFTVFFWGAMWTFLGVLAALRTNLSEMLERDAVS